MVFNYGLYRTVLEKIPSITANNSNALSDIQVQSQFMNNVSTKKRVVTTIMQCMPLIYISFQQKRSDVFEVLTNASSNSTLKEQSYDNALRSFERNLQRAGVRIRQNVPRDGNCLFHVKKAKGCEDEAYRVTETCYWTL